jgi:hypothetical protein
LTSIGTNYLSFLPLISRIAGARVLPIPALDFKLDTGYQIDVTATVQSAQLEHGIQSLWVDGGGATYGVFTVQVFGTGQLVRVPAGYQGYVPVLCVNTFIFTVTNPSVPNTVATGTQMFNMAFLNVPFVSGLWIAAGGYGVGGLGQLGLGG